MTPSDPKPHELMLHLSGDGYLIILLITQRALCLVCVVKLDGDSGLGNACLSVLVHQLLKVGGAHLPQNGHTEG